MYVIDLQSGEGDFTDLVPAANCPGGKFSSLRIILLALVLYFYTLIVCSRTLIVYLLR